MGPIPAIVKLIKQTKLIITPKVFIPVVLNDNQILHRPCLNMKRKVALARCSFHCFKVTHTANLTMLYDGRRALSIIITERVLLDYGTPNKFYREMKADLAPQK